MNLVERFEELKKKKEEYTKTKIQCEVKRDTLSAEIKSDLDLLVEKYGVKNLEEAKHLLQKSDAELNAKVTELETELSKFENATKEDL